MGRKMKDNRERGQKASFCRHQFGTLMSTAMSGRKIAERASADFDMGAFISIRRPISLSRVAARGEWERGRRRGGEGPVLGLGWSESLFPGRKEGRDAEGRHSIRSRSAEIPSRATFLSALGSGRPWKLLRGGRLKPTLHLQEC